MKVPIRKTFKCGFLPGSLRAKRFDMKRKMETTYYKDTIRSYMIIACPPEAETKGYQYRMLEMNRIDGLLPCSIRHIDGAKYLYYDITGKQNLKTLYEERKITGAEMFRFLKATDAVSESLSGYLLDEQQVVLDEELIFYDFQTGNYWFTYYPGSTEPSGVFQFLANVIDASDKRAAAAAYRLWSLEGGNRQALREAVREEASDELQGENKRKVYDTGRRREDPEPAEAPRILYDTKSKGKEETEEKRTGKEEKKGIRLWLRILLILLLSAGAGGLIAVQYFVYITQRERRLCIAGAALLLLAAVMLIAETVLRSVRDRKKKKEEEEKRAPVYVKSNESDLPVFGGGEDRADYALGEETNTVRFSEQASVGRLYGRERGSRIDLRTLPVTIGKAQSFADVVLDDPSVSRVHARIYKGEEGGIEIRDLGSTNGTRINGVAIPPNEKVRVQRGDEVKFGNLEYEYR